MRWIKKLLLPSLVVLFSLLVSAFGFGKQASAVRDYSTLSSTIPYSVEAKVNNVYQTLTGNYNAGVSAAFYYLPNSITCSNKTTAISDFRFSDFRNGFTIPKHSDFTFILYWAFDSLGTDTVPYQDTFTHIPSRLTIGGGRYYYLVNHDITYTKNDIDEYYTRTTIFMSLTFRNDSDNDIVISARNTDTKIELGWNGFPNICNYSSVSFQFAGGYTEPILKSEAEVANEEQQKDDEDRQNLENQTSETESDANEQGAAAQSTGTSLLGVFSAFVSSLAQIHETNCLLPNISVYGLDLGRMDLCTFDIPPSIIALATVGMIFIIVPLSFHLARRLINIFRSFQG